MISLNCNLPDTFELPLLTLMQLTIQLILPLITVNMSITPSSVVKTLEIVALEEAWWWVILVTTILTVHLTVTHLRSADTLLHVVAEELIC